MCIGGLGKEPNPYDLSEVGVSGGKWGYVREWMCIGGLGKEPNPYDLSDAVTQASHT